VGHEDAFERPRLSATAASSTLSKTFDSSPIVGRMTRRACIVSRSFRAENFLCRHGIRNDTQPTLLEIADGSETHALLAHVLVLPSHEPQQEVRPILI